MVISWHVDYWDRLGWPDPFGSAAISARQSDYAKARSERGRWTPQWRVEGASLRGGGLGQRIQQELQRAMAKTPKVRIGVSAGWVEPDVGADDDDPTGAEENAGPRIEVHLQVALVRAGTELPKLTRVVPILVQRKAVTAVPKGENAGKTLTEYLIAHTLGQSFPVGEATDEQGADITFPAPKGQKRENLAVAVIVEDPETMQPIEARLVPVTVPTPEGNPR